MQIDLSTIVKHWYMILGLLVLTMGLKALIQFAMLAPFVQIRSNFKSALALFQIGEFALAVFALAFQNHLINNRTNQILIITVVLSMIITPFVLKNLKTLADKMFTEPEHEFVMQSTGFSNHIIIIGYGPIGQKIANNLKTYGICYIIIEHEMDLVKEGEANGERIFLDSASGSLRLTAATDALARHSRWPDRPIESRKRQYETACRTI